MKVSQIFELVNGATSEILGESVVVLEDLSNVVTVGKEIVDTDNLDNYVKKLVNHIGKVVFVDRVYNGSAPSVLMDEWEFGSILEKISCELPTASENSEFSLVGGQSYDQDIFYKPVVSAKFFNSKVTFEIPLSFTEKQVKESFSSVEQLNGFLSMLFNAVNNSMTVKLDALIMRTINNMVGETLYADLENAGTFDLTETGIKAVNLLKLYNATVTDHLTVAKCLTNTDFIRYATYTIAMYSDRLTKISTLFNIEGKERFSPVEKQKVLLLSDFAKASETFLSSNTFNSEKVALPIHDSISYWQGSGTDYAFAEVSKVSVKTSTGKTVSASGVIGAMFDYEALGVANLERRVTTHYNAKAEFYTNFYKFDAGYYNDLSENFIVFFVG